MKTAKYFLALGVALTSGAVLAQTGAGGGTGNASENNRQNRTDQGSQTQLPSVNSNVQVDFGSLDSNGNQILSLDEVESNSALSQAFSRLDTDRSGGLSDAEFAKFEGGEDDTETSGSTKSKSQTKTQSKQKSKTSTKEKIDSGND